LTQKKAVQTTAKIASGDVISHAFCAD